MSFYWFIGEMKVLIISTFSDPLVKQSFKGGYRRVTQLAKLLEPYFYVKILNMSSRYWAQESLSNFKIEIVHGNILLRIVKCLLRVILERDKWDLIILYNPTFFTLPFIIFRKIIKKPIVLDYVDKQGIDLQMNKIFKYLNIFSEKYAIRRLTYFITSSKYLSFIIKKKNKSAQIYLYRGTFDILNKNLIKNTNTQKKKKLKIIYIGTWLKANGVEELIHAFSIVKTKVPHELIVIGSGPEKFKIKLFAKQVRNVKVYEGISDQKLWEYMNYADILTVPYLNSYRNQFNFPSKIIEYLAFGKPILATNIGEISRLLKHKINAWLVEPNTEEISKGLEILIENEGIRRSLAENALKLFNSEFRNELVGKKLRKYLLSCL